MRQKVKSCGINRMLKFLDGVSLTQNFFPTGGIKDLNYGLRRVFNLYLLHTQRHNTKFSVFEDQTRSTTK